MVTWPWTNHCFLVKKNTKQHNSIHSQALFRSKLHVRGTFLHGIQTHFIRIYHNVLSRHANSLLPSSRDNILLSTMRYSFLRCVKYPYIVLDNSINLSSSIMHKWSESVVGSIELLDDELRWAQIRFRFDLHDSISPDRRDPNAKRAMRIVNVRAEINVLDFGSERYDVASIATHAQCKGSMGHYRQSLYCARVSSCRTRTHTCRQRNNNNIDFTRLLTYSRSILSNTRTKSTRQFDVGWVHARVGYSAWVELR